MQLLSFFPPIESLQPQPVPDNNQNVKMILKKDYTILTCPHSHR